MKPLYVHTENVHNTKAAEVVVPIILDIYPAKSVLDVGCGTGTWLKVFQDHEINNFIGVDSSYVSRSQLQIEDNKFVAHDLTKPLDLKREFDLVISLEVAEHLPAPAADVFVETLVRHSKVIVFSAAIPGQGGQNHLNEQWPNYWEEKFKKFGYLRHDLVRPKIWSNKIVDIWYRQNIFLFSRDENFRYDSSNSLVPYIHPDLWNEKINLLKRLSKENAGFNQGKSGIKRSFTAIINAIKLKMTNG